MDQNGAFPKLVTEHWRLLRLLDRLVHSQPADTKQAGAAAAQLRYARGRLEAILAESGLRLITYENSPYSPNLPVTVANADDFVGDDNLVIAETLEPTLTGDGKVMATGKVVLRKEG